MRLNMTVWESSVWIDSCFLPATVVSEKEEEEESAGERKGGSKRRKRGKREKGESLRMRNNKRWRG
jgi:hypothetical protein